MSLRYIVLLVGGLALLLRNQRQPWWLLLAAPPLVYNLTERNPSQAARRESERIDMVLFVKP